MTTEEAKERLHKLGEELTDILMMLGTSFASVEAVQSDRLPAVWIRTGKISGESVTYTIKQCKYDDGADWRDGV